MISKYCNDFIKNIRYYFSYLFDLYGFKVVYDKSVRKGESCLIILQSDACRIKFYRSQGEVNLMFGTLSSQMDWENVINGEHHWYYVRGVLDFIEKKPIMPLNVLILNVPKTCRTEEQQLAELSQRLQPLCLQAIELFREENFIKTKKEYEEWDKTR